MGLSLRSITEPALHAPHLLADVAQRPPSLINTLVFLCALGICAYGTSVVLKRAGSIGLDEPDERRKSHAQPIARLGGLAIYLTLMAGFAFAALRMPGFLEKWWPVILTNTMLFAVGFADDLRPLGAKVKFLAQIGVACILYACDISIDNLSNPFGSGTLDLGWWSFPLTVLWLVAIPNIINLIDGMDGLASGFGLFLCLTLAFVGHYNERPDIVLISVVMSGALAGFLIYNFPPAKIFLGDGGAYLIGFFIASSSLLSSQKGSIMAALLVMVVALGVPILDTALAIVRRAIRGVPIFRADAEHIHHRLMTIGFSKTRALVALYAASLVLSLIGMAIFVYRGLALPIAAAALFLAVLLVVRYLGYVKNWRRVRTQMNEAMKRRKEMLFTSLCGRLAEWEAERCHTPAEFVAELKHALKRSGLEAESSPETRPLPIKLKDGSTCVLHYDARQRNSTEWWLAKADAFVPAIDYAYERWGVPPGLEIQPRKTTGPLPLRNGAQQS